jgi:hypothetical protein
MDSDHAAKTIVSGARLAIELVVFLPPTLGFLWFMHSAGGLLSAALFAIPAIILFIGGHMIITALLRQYDDSHARSSA